MVGDGWLLADLWSWRTMGDGTNHDFDERFHLWNDDVYICTLYAVWGASPRMVYPNRMLGQQLLDAGIVQFAPGSQLDVQKSMGSWAPNSVISACHEMPVEGLLKRHCTLVPDSCREGRGLLPHRGIVWYRGKISMICYHEITLILLPGFGHPLGGVAWQMWIIKSWRVSHAHCGLIKLHGLNWFGFNGVATCQSGIVSWSSWPIAHLKVIMLCSLQSQPFLGSLVLCSTTLAWLITPLQTADFNDEASKTGRSSVWSAAEFEDWQSLGELDSNSFVIQLRTCPFLVLIQYPQPLWTTHVIYHPWLYKVAILQGFSVTVQC